MKDYVRISRGRRF
jgi:hypothetical protein